MTRQFIFISTLLFGLIFSCSSPADKKVDTTPIIDTLNKKTVTSSNSDSLEMMQFINDNNLNVIDTFSVGDVDGDGKKDKAMIQPIALVWKNDKLDSQYVNITFTCSIPAIKHQNGFGGIIVNVGDLDGNKTEEIIYDPSWFQSNWGDIYIYGYRRNKWTVLSQCSIYHGSIEEGEDPIKFLKNRVKKINNHSFKLLQHTIAEDSGEIIDSTTIVVIK